MRIEPLKPLILSIALAGLEVAAGYAIKNPHQDKNVSVITPTPTELPEIQATRLKTGNDILLERSQFDQKTTP